MSFATTPRRLVRGGQIRQARGHGLRHPKPPGNWDSCMAKTRRGRTEKRATRPARRPTARATTRFVGRDSSPVLDHYPPKEPASTPKPPVSVSQPSTTALPANALAPLASPATAPGQPLITLDRPFDVDDFSTLLGETSIRVTVPREALPEVLHRVLEFMGFGIYVYSISVRPAPAELLKGFVLELQRVDYSAEKGAWVPFVEKGTTDSPFGPSGDRT